MKEKQQLIETMDKENYFENEKPASVAVKMHCGRKWQNLMQFINDAKFCETMEIVLQFFSSDPLLLGAFSFIIATVTGPLLLFSLFAISNVAVAFMSFFMIEVSVLTIGAAVIGCSLFCVISTITTMGLGLGIVYHVAYYILSVIRSIKERSVPD